MILLSFNGHYYYFFFTFNLLIYNILHYKVISYFDIFLLPLFFLCFSIRLYSCICVWKCSQKYFNQNHNSIIHQHQNCERNKTEYFIEDTSFNLRFPSYGTFHFEVHSSSFSMDSVLMETIQTNDVKAIFYVINKKKSAGEKKNILWDRQTL